MGLLGTVKKDLIRLSELLLKKAWLRDFLTKEQTISYLSGSLLSDTSDSYVKLPAVRDAIDNKMLFEANEAYGSRNQVWSFKAGASDSYLLKIGSVISDNKVFETDYGYPNLYTDDFGGKHVFADFLGSDNRRHLHTDILIAPWSQYFRPEYFGYITLVAAKICRMKKALPKEIFEKALISYPLLNTAYEKDMLEFFGFHSDHIIDSRFTKVTFDVCILGNNDSWSYPNPQDVLLLREFMASKVLVKPDPKGERIYIRRSGRRRVLNEEHLIKMLEKFNFLIIEDIPRTVADQYTIYNNAKFIMGPHGGSFANVIWCNPGTHLFEFFPQTYIYNFFLYLCQVLGMSYSAYCNGPVIPNYSYKSVNDDITVDVGEVEKYLEKMLG